LRSKRFVEYANYNASSQHLPPVAPVQSLGPVFDDAPRKLPASTPTLESIEPFDQHFGFLLLPGTGAVGAATVNLLLGMLISLRYSPVQRCRIAESTSSLLHQWTAYIAVALALTHPMVLLFLRAPHFRLFDILLPIYSPLQPKLNLAGAAALYLLALVFVSSLLRNRIGRPVLATAH